MLHDQGVFSESTVRHLASRQGDPAIVSLYLDVDGLRYPRPSDYEPHLDHLFRVARDLAEAEGKATVAAVEPDLARIAEWMAEGLDRSSTRGLALFSASAQGLFEAFTLPVPVRDQVVLAPRADVVQLIAVLLATSPILVVAANRQASRLLRIGRDGVVTEVEAPVDEVERRIDNDVELGSFEHRHEEHVREHLRRVARAAADELRRNGDARLVLSGEHDVTRQLESCLPKDAAAAVVGRMALPTSSTAADFSAAASAVAEEARRGQQLAVVEEVRERAAEGAEAVAGLVATLDALSAGQVETLVVDACFTAPGGRCTSCGALVAGDGPCPTCGGAVMAMGNVVDVAVTDAFVRHVTLELCQGGELDELGHIAAIIRQPVRPTPSGE